MHSNSVSQKGKFGLPNYIGGSAISFPNKEENWESIFRLYCFVSGMSSNQSPILFFDGVCHLCQHSVRWIIRHDPEGKIKFASLQSRLARKQLGDLIPQLNREPESVVFIRNGLVYTHSTAALQVLAELGLPWSLLLVFQWVPVFLRDAVYRLVARNRYRWFGKSESCMVPDPKWKERFPGEGLHPENA